MVVASGFALVAMYTGSVLSRRWQVSSFRREHACGRPFIAARRYRNSLPGGPGRSLEIQRDEGDVVDDLAHQLAQQTVALIVIHGRHDTAEQGIEIGVAVVAPVDRAPAF